MRSKAPVSLLSFSLLLSPVLASSSNTAVCNANHIFNAIHSSMRQWGGSLNHNGMSLFLATVPEGTQLYHGTSSPDFVKGMQWLAFEPEHALIFARPHGGPGGPPPGGDDGEGPPPSDGRVPGAEGMSHDEEGWSYYEPPPEHKSGGHGFPPAHHDEDHGKPYPHPSHDGKDREHQRPPPPHDHKPCNGRECGSQPTHHEHGPPPLPPGHIYKPYPPPPRKDRPFKGPKRPWDAEHRRPPPAHQGDSPKHHSPPPHNHDDSPGHPPPEQEKHAHYIPKEPIELRSAPAMPQRRRTQQPLRDSTPLQEERTGYLHTYAPMHDLKLLYIDGLSAGKTSNGTLDTQDLLLLNLTSDNPGGPHGPMGGEMARAEGLCALAATMWEGRIDGFIRLEGGFEIILCDFEQHLRLVEVISVSQRSEGGGKGRGRGVMGGWRYLQAITSRYHGIGGQRVQVDYSDFVSVFQYQVPGLWDNDVHSSVAMPRLTNVAPSTLSTIRSDITALILRKDWSSHPSGPNWQATADMIIARYSAPLHHLATHAAFRQDPDLVTTYLTGLLRPFISPTARNASLETSRCTAQFVPALSSLAIPPASLPGTAHTALHAVTTRICDALLTSLSIAAAPKRTAGFSGVHAQHAVEVVQELVDWLAWTSWKDCGPCADEEVCFIPIWPSGSWEDHARPRCRGEKEVQGRVGYWGRMGPPPGKGREVDGGKKGGKGWKMGG